MIIQRGSLRTKNKTCSKEYPLREYEKKAAQAAFFFCISSNYPFSNHFPFARL